MSNPVPAIACWAALFALASAGPAAAQSTPDGRGWIDPPARGAAVAPAAPAASVAETPPAASPAPTPEPRGAVSKRRVAASERRAVAPRHHAAASKPPKAVAKTPVVTIRRRPVAVARSQPVPVRLTRTPVRYGFVAPPPFSYVGDPRARRIRQAEAAGYLVMRRTTFAAPDGRLLYGYRPYAADDFDD